VRDLYKPEELLRMVSCLYVRGLLTEAEHGHVLKRLARRYGTKLGRGPRPDDKKEERRE